MNEYLIQADRHIAQLKLYIAHQRTLVECEIQQRRDPALAAGLLHAYEASLRAFEGYRHTHFEWPKAVEPA